MPVELERKLKQRAKDMGLKGDRKDAYVYGTMRDTGWVPSTQKKSQSEAMVHQLRNRGK